MKKIFKNKLYIISICMIVLASILNILARACTGFSETYANTFYILWATVFSRLFSIIPISVFEALIAMLVFYISDRLIRMILRIVRHKTLPKEEGKRLLKTAVPFIVVTGASVYLLFMISCGINYHRQPFSVVEGIKTNPYSKEELKEVCEYLTNQVNLSASKILYDADKHMVPQPHVEERAAETMTRAAQNYPALAGYYPRAKKFYIYQGLSSQAIAGVFVCFTMEPHYNDDMPYYNIPHAICHELSHLRGFMREDEAGFIAYLACIDSEYEDFVYSGYLSAYVYCMNSLYRADAEAYKELRDKLCETADSDLEYNNEYWAEHDGVVAKVTDQVNDAYLKSNAQTDGVASYGRMTDLVVAKYFEDQAKR